MNTAQSALERIDRNLFGGELNNAFLWAILEVRTMVDQDMGQQERRIRLAKIIQEKYPQVGLAGQIFLAAMVIAAV